jgi:hypothetical protein
MIRHQVHLSVVYYIAKYGELDGEFFHQEISKYIYQRHDLEHCTSDNGFLDVVKFTTVIPFSFII